MVYLVIYMANEIKKVLTEEPRHLRIVKLSITSFDNIAVMDNLTIDTF